MVIKSWRIWVAHVEIAAKMLHLYGILVGKPVSRGRVEVIHKWKENIKFFLEEGVRL